MDKTIALNSDVFSKVLYQVRSLDYVLRILKVSYSTEFCGLGFWTQFRDKFRDQLNPILPRSFLDCVERFFF